MYDASEWFPSSISACPWGQGKKKRKNRESRNKRLFRVVVPGLRERKGMGGENSSAIRVGEKERGKGRGKASEKRKKKIVHQGSPGRLP